MALQKQITVRDERDESRGKRSRNMRTWVAIALVTIVLFLAVGCVVIWVTVPPKRLIFTVEDGLIRNFTLLNNTDPHHLFSANFSFNFSVANCNYRVGFTFEMMNVTALISTDEALAYYTMPDELRVQRNTTSDSPMMFSVTLSPRDVPLTDPVYNPTPPMIFQYIRVNLTLTSRVKFKPRRWPLDHKIQIYCYGVMLHYRGANATQPTPCYVDL